MNIPLDVSLAPMIQPIAGPAAELDRLGDEMVIIRARLEPEAGAVVVQALTAAREACTSAHGRRTPWAVPRDRASRTVPRERRSAWRATRPAW